MATREDQDEGWNMWTWSRQWDVRSRREALVLVSMGLGSLEVTRCRITEARRWALKCWSGSRRMTALDWPLRGTEANVEGRMAWAMMR